jgi:CHASE3 domain sensor protein
MDRSRYQQQVNPQQIQYDLPGAVTDAQALLDTFETEAVEKLDRKVQALVFQVNAESEKRLEDKLQRTLREFYRQEQKRLQDFYQREQRRFNRRFLIITIWLSALTLLFMGACILFGFVLRPH